MYRKEPASGSASVSHRPRDFTTPTLGARTLPKCFCGLAALDAGDLASVQRQLIDEASKVAFGYKLSANCAA